MPTESKNAASKRTTSPTSETGSTEFFTNCTELREKYPDGVPSTYSTYKAKMDRDHDNYACEK
ncbi:excalibur calcium-binding domain-containing protein [Heyndrickxia oleronia]|uniref:excalibur calcium-binding domain-containing protein n=1 Tax=Heyndrickxia oleronia TaxID=38875 RepID=UPI0009AEB5DE|nr:excalibur calcium-binding domain-containing protein [Heyndrickxia oleronia]MCI1589986.1 excalibur calcium-binding domain-containing protein [Heyndrickxia oleronia]MCI1613388.1 excalibur calcium-binding domain-containing protein [Heyndrickxia oleronia]MCI1744704.1 excalibur calcium-binding domain-containing protein [Heyndrickxia oleronia]MCI1761337.1 excalibur calcium-binding domain-containing protein [Heyndrickxia oleronia]